MAVHVGTQVYVGDHRAAAVAIQTRDPAEDDEQVGRYHAGHQRGQVIVVADRGFVVGEGVVFVDHRHRSALEQHLEGMPGG
jgi:hypothetical protein